MQPNLSIQSTAFSWHPIFDSCNFVSSEAEQVCKFKVGPIAPFFQAAAAGLCAVGLLYAVTQITTEWETIKCCKQQKNSLHEIEPFLSESPKKNLKLKRINKICQTTTTLIIIGVVATAAIVLAYYFNEERCVEMRSAVNATCLSYFKK